MHKLTSKPITLECFEIDDYTQQEFVENQLIPYLEGLRQEYLRLQKIVTTPEDLDTAAEAKKVWKELVRWLPESWLQTRTVIMNYENVLSIVHQRRFHKLSEWSGDKDYIPASFIKMAKELPYSKDFIFIDELKSE